MRAIWIGIEDLTATLVKKGQSADRTTELFALLNKVGICPMPMMMHHDGQPLYTRKGSYGLLNQVEFLRRNGAQSLQVTVLTPAVGTRAYEAYYHKRLVFDKVGGKPVLQYQFDGNHVVASSLAKPWRTQLNVLLAYAAYYNPVNLIRSVVRPANSLFLAGAYDQVIGMIGLCRTAVQFGRWAFDLWRGPITRKVVPPGPKTPMIDASLLPESLDVRASMQAAGAPASAPVGAGTDGIAGR